MKVICIPILLLALSQVHAQPTARTISGLITSRSAGTPIPNAMVTLAHTSFIAHTDSSGTFRLYDIPAGVYELRVSASGFTKLVCYDLVVPENAPVVVPIKLDAGYDSTITSTMRIASPPEIKDRILYYRPDSTIDFKLRTVDPTKSRDSSKVRKK